jgi:hypothetical protein
VPRHRDERKSMPVFPFLASPNFLDGLNMPPSLSIYEKYLILIVLSVDSMELQII